MKKKIISFILISALTLFVFLFLNNKDIGTRNTENNNIGSTDNQSEKEDPHPLTIEAQRKKDYPGSQITIEQNLSSGSNYQRFVASYLSDGFKIYGLLTIPNGTPPEGSWPAVIFNHGYIPPGEYRTTEKYVAYQDGFARNGFVTFKSDYRGHGTSEGNPEGAYYSDAYLTDVLNAVTSIQKMKEVNADKIGMWGHSMGGHLTLRSMVVNQKIKAGVIWAGVVASYDDMMNNWRRSIPWRPSQSETQFRRPSRQELIDKYGNSEQNPIFWQSISPIYFVGEISGPIQLHHGTSDASVPWEFSQSLNVALEKASKTHEYYLYEGTDHNLSGPAFNIAMQRSIEFFNKYLK